MKWQRRVADTPDMESAPIPKRWWLGLFVFIVTTGALAAQLRPVIVYHLTVAPDLVERGFADRLEPRTLSQFKEPPRYWPRLSVSNLELRAPIARTSGVDPCRSCAGHCLLQVAGGTLAVFSEPPIEDLAHVLDGFAPSASEIRPFRSRMRNWATVEAVASRAPNRRLPESFRFDAAESQGVVTVHSSGNTERFVIYAYGRVGTPTRVVGLASVSRETLHSVIGSMAVAGADLSARDGDEASQCATRQPNGPNWIAH